MTAVVHNYRDLIVWQKAMAFAKEVYRLSKGFPGDERYGMTSQIRRAALSVPSNIAEGHARQGRKFRHFLSIARGSLAEVETQLLFTVEVGYLHLEQLQLALSFSDGIKRMSAVLSKRIKDATP